MIAFIHCQDKDDNDRSWTENNQQPRPQQQQWQQDSERMELVSPMTLSRTTAATIQENRQHT